MDSLEKLLDDMQNEDTRQRLENMPREQRFRSINRDTAEFISVLSRISNAKTLVEIGSSVGYSTIWLGLVAKSLGGHLTTFETEKWKFDQAEKNIETAGLKEFVTIHHNDPREHQDLMPSAIDLVFLDAEKADYVSHFHAFFKKLNPGGIIIADNAVSHFAELREYIEMVRDHEECNSVIASSVGKGLEITYKMRKNELKEWNILIR